MHKTLVSALAGLAIFAAGSITSAHAGGVAVGIAIGVPFPAPVYYEPAYAYYPPPPVYYAPRVVYAPPVYYVPRVIYPRHHNRERHHRHWR